MKMETNNITIPREAFARLVDNLRVAAEKEPTGYTDVDFHRNEGWQSHAQGVLEELNDMVDLSQFPPLK